MKKLYLVLVSFLALMLFGCNGHNEDGTENLPQIVTHIELSLLDSQGNAKLSFSKDETVTLQAKVTDENNILVANKAVNFSSSIGSLAVASKLTNSDGIAIVYVNNDSLSLGAGSANASIGEVSALAIDFEFVDSKIRLGYFDQNNNFVEGKIELSIADNNISTGGTLGLSVDLVDENNALITTSILVTFTSNCVKNGNASIDESVLSIHGTARSTFADINCAGTTGTDDIISASIAVNNMTSTANETISISGGQFGSIEFISAEPASIVLRGTGGQNKQETSTLTFKVKNQLGNVLAQQEVFFELSTSVGGIKLGRTSGLTNNQGLITTQVIAGTVPTPIRVTASASMLFNDEVVKVQTQSDLLSINTGLPEQRSMTIAASVLNPEAYDDAKSTITAWLSDNFHNPVPDGTTVNFTTEGGNVEPSCSTINGSCSVVWTSSEPRVANHRVTILATALGHESFVDTNGNNIFDNADGNPIHDSGNSNNFNVDSGFDNYSFYEIASGFVDMSEAWRDDNENSVCDDGETFLDFNNDGECNDADNLFNGPQCEGDKCSVEKPYTHVRKALVLIMASSTAETILTNSDGSVVYRDSLTGASVSLPDVSNGGRQSFNFSFADTGTPNQTMPFETSVEISISAGELQGTTSLTVSNNNREGYTQMNFFVFQDAGNQPELAFLTFTITSPSGVETTFTREIALL